MGVLGIIPIGALYIIGHYTNWVKYTAIRLHLSMGSFALIRFSL